MSYYQLKWQTVWRDAGPRRARLCFVLGRQKTHPTIHSTKTMAAYRKAETVVEGLLAINSTLRRVCYLLEQLHQQQSTYAPKEEVN